MKKYAYVFKHQLAWMGLMLILITTWFSGFVFIMNISNTLNINAGYFAFLYFILSGILMIIAATFLYKKD